MGCISSRFAVFAVQTTGKRKTYQGMRFISFQSAKNNHFQITQPFQVNILLPIGFLIVCVFLIVLPIVDDPMLVGVAMGILVAGIPVYLVFIYWTSKPKWLKNWIYSWDIAVQKLFLAVPTDNTSDDD